MIADGDFNCNIDDFASRYSVFSNCVEIEQDMPTCKSGSLFGRLEKWFRNAPLHAIRQAKLNVGIQQFHGQPTAAASEHILGSLHTCIFIYICIIIRRSARLPATALLNIIRFLLRVALNNARSSKTVFFLSLCIFLGMEGPRHQYV